MQLKVSVDQDLTVIVREALNDDVVKRWLVSIVFHASVTQQRSSALRHVSRALMYMKRNRTHPFKQRFEKKGATLTGDENMMKADDNYTLEQRNWKTIDLLSFDSHLLSKTLVTFHKLEECTSGCSDESSKQHFQHLRSKTPVKTPVTLELVLTRMHKITRLGSRAIELFSK